jgi:hypothetical protein
METQLVDMSAAVMGGQMADVMVDWMAHAMAESTVGLMD